MSVEKKVEKADQYSKESLSKMIGGYKGIIETCEKHMRWIEKSHYFNPKGLHGPDHTQRVMILAILIGQLYRISEEEEKILIFSSLYHDIGRHNDQKDSFHGTKSVQKVKALKRRMRLNCSQELDIATMIIRYHSVDDSIAMEEHKKIQRGWSDKAYTTMSKLYLIFKDADNLDRVRINDLDIRYLRNKESVKLTSFAEDLYYFHQKESSVIPFLK
ncbi:HD domain-containing protein [Tindallia californiensis]|nr:HD domain-containing protein [Tindallia californiensis]